MKNFTVSQLIRSLIMPLFTFGYGIIAFVGENKNGFASFNGYDAVRMTYMPLVTLLLGGLLPILLTLFRNIHTERYFIKRLCVFVACYVLNYVGMKMPFGILSTLLFIAILVGDVVYELLKVMDEDTTKGERAVILLSDFFIWLSIDYCMMAFQSLVGMTLI